MLGPGTTFTSIGARWANVSNTPYQHAKASSYEGGVRTPLIAFWPKGITAQKGGISDRAGHVMDFMATFIEVAKARYPESYKGNSIKPLQGVSLVTAFSDNNRNPLAHKALFNEHFGAKYVRFEGWKLVARNNQPWQLFRINDDETEMNDLSKQNQDIVNRLDKMWQEWAMQNQVLPKSTKANP